jgi:hypothetical protein
MFWTSFISRQFSPASCYFTHLRSKQSPHHSVLKSLSQCQCNGHISTHEQINILIVTILDEFFWFIKQSYWIRSFSIQYSIQNSWYFFYVSNPILLKPFARANSRGKHQSCYFTRIFSNLFISPYCFYAVKLVSCLISAPSVLTLICRLILSSLSSFCSAYCCTANAGRAQAWGS